MSAISTCFIAPVYNYDPVLIHSLRLQSSPSWEVFLLHDGPNSTGLKSQLRSLNDPRLRYYETARRFDDWGHSLRALALIELASEMHQTPFLVITNGDNYYCPGFLEIMQAAFQRDTVAVYCSMAHNHRQWQLIDAALRHRQIDCGCVMVRTEAALAVGWRSREHAADWVFIADLIERYGEDRFAKVENVLFVHN